MEKWLPHKILTYEAPVIMTSQSKFIKRTRKQVSHEQVKKQDRELGSKISDIRVTGYNL